MTLIATLLIKGVLIGFLFGIPVGAIGALTIQRTLNHGVRAGLLTGFGSSVADCLYASVGVFGLALIAEFFQHYQFVICLIGGVLVFCMGIRTLFQKVSDSEAGAIPLTRWKIFLSSFVIGITNPVVILLFMSAFSMFRIPADLGSGYGAVLIAGVMGGTYLWWLILSLGSNRFREQATRHRGKVNRVFGIILILFALFIWGKIVLPLLKL